MQGLGHSRRNLRGVGRIQRYATLAVAAQRKPFHRTKPKQEQQEPQDRC
jgi:hypothetical protein